jgi:type I restriction enzyme, S subunit
MIKYSLHNLPKGWKVEKLGQVASFLDGSRIPIKEADRAKMQGIYPYYGASGIIDYVNDYLFDGEYVLLGEDGANILSRTQPLAFRVSGKIWVNNHAHVIQAGPEMDVGFLTEYLESISYVAYNTGTAQPKLPQSTCLQIDVIVPPLPEQRKIAQILSTWDEAIATVDALIAALQRRKQGLMQRLLTGQVRFGEFAARPWRKATLGDFVEPVNRSESILPDRDYRLLGVRWYLQGAHIHNIVAGSSIVTKTLNRVESGDILYNKMWVSKNAFAVAKDEHHGSYGSNEYPQFRAKNGLNVEYIEQAFHNGRFLHDATALCRGTTGRIRLNPEDFLQLVLSLPEQDEQDRIADVLISAQEEISAMSAYLAQLRQQKKGLMQRLLTGQVRVNVGEEMQ